MSYTEIYKFNSRGYAKLIGEVQNAHRGCSAIWYQLEAKHLPPYVPGWVRHIPASLRRDSYSRVTDPDDIYQIWGLFESGLLSRAEKICLGTTFDNAIVKGEDVPELVAALRAFGGENSLEEQADIIEAAYKKDARLTGITWNQTSVGEFWAPLKAPTGLKYNLLTMNAHYDFFPHIT